MRIILPLLVSGRRAMLPTLFVTFSHVGPWARGARFRRLVISSSLPSRVSLIHRRASSLPRTLMRDKRVHRRQRVRAAVLNFASVVSRALPKIASDQTQDARARARIELCRLVRANRKPGGSSPSPLLLVQLRRHYPPAPSPPFRRRNTAPTRIAADLSRAC